MPSSGICYTTNPAWIHQEAKRQVRAKFPNLLEGSSGWMRAVENRMKRIR